MKDYIRKIKINIEKARHLSLKTIVRKILNKSSKKLKSSIQKREDFLKSTHISQDIPLLTTHFIDINEFKNINFNKDVAYYLSKMYLEHRFDILGSGWLKNSYNSISPGIENYKFNMNIPLSSDNFLPPHRRDFERIYSLIDDNYTPIDWQKDIKSGF